MNGVLVCDHVIGSEDWNSHVAKLKVDSSQRNPQFAKATEGYLFLGKGNQKVAFRNIKIRVLP